MTRDQLQQRFNFLKDDNNFPTTFDKRNRGRQFELLLNNLLKIEDLEPRTSYRPDGEEIDGSFIFGNKIYLLEAKWHSTAIPASSIYQFKGKVDGKLVGTIGIFISMSGFSSEAVDALTFGKSVNVILFDQSDLEISITEHNGLKKVLHQKIRIAAEEGHAFFPTKSISISTKNVEENVKTLEDIGHENLIIIVEGQTDSNIITAVAERVFRETGKTKNIRIIVAGGKYSVAKMANSVRDISQQNDTIILVADSDYDIEQTNLILTNTLEFRERFHTIIPDPHIETWFLNKTLLKDDLRKLQNELKKGRVSVEKLVSEINFQELRKTDEAFGKLYEILTENNL